MAAMNNFFSCPHCSHNVYFPNEVSNHLVCTCGNVVYKDKDNLPVKKFISVITGSEDIIQLGTEGVWEGNKFIVSGRFRAWFEENVFNYWTIDLANGKVYYLAEGYGLYSIYETLSIQDELNSHNLEMFKPDSILSIQGTGEYRFLRKNESHYCDVEGSFYKREGNVLKTFEAMSDDGNLVAIFESGKNIIDTFTVHPVDFEALNFIHLRQASNAGKTFICTECDHQNTLLHYPYSQSWVCGNCGTAFSLVNTGQVKREGKMNDSYGINIPLGTIMTLFDTTYSVIGFACKEDSTGQSGMWKEYTLYNVQKGYAFLNESDGHWMLLKEMLRTPGVKCIKQHIFRYNSRTFKLYSKYQYSVIYAAGEFPGNIFNDTYASDAYDFISPPEIWSAEMGINEGVTWFHGSHISKKTLKRQTGASLPLKTGVGLLQPGASMDVSLLIKTTVVLLLAVIGIHVLFGISSKEKVMLDQEFMMADSLNAQTFITNKFELTKWKSNLEFDIYAPVDNSWFEVGATLVNAENGNEYSIEQGVEYYHGYTDGENWAEGGRNETAYLSSIPSGTYFLRIDGIRDAGVTGYDKVPSFHVKAKYDVPMFRNLVFTILALLLYPTIVIWVSNNVERNRWFGSPFSPYNYNN